jgi:geranylgeranyl reductase family protein
MSAPRAETDVLVIGAGPAGCAAAISLARRGVDVLVADRAEFPRDKVCGDALIPDALRALETLGLRDRVLALARGVGQIKLYAPGGGEVAFRGRCAVVRRLVFDDQLRQAAAAAGARFLTPYRAIAPVTEASSYSGAVLQDVRRGSQLRVRARWTILCTGAAADVLKAFGVCERAEASGTAARIYFEVPGRASATHDVLAMSFERDLLPGYGWMFPVPGNLFNVGVVVFHDARRTHARVNLRSALSRFIERFEPARAVSRAAISTTRLAGAPIRTSLRGARVSRPGLLLAGEAAGTTYALTGEGIGKALETGILAASTIAEGLGDGRDPARVSASYASHLESTYRERFAGYARAQRLAEYPALADLIAWRARVGPLVPSLLEGMFNETALPGELFSARGLVRSLLRRG